MQHLESRNPKITVMQVVPKTIAGVRLGQRDPDCLVAFGDSRKLPSPKHDASRVRGWKQAASPSSTLSCHFSVQRFVDRALQSL
jgi:hypothetical protein